LCLLLIAFGAITDGIIKNVAVCSTYFITCQLLHGAFQATGGPVNTAIMGNWWPAKGRGLVFGLWTCHQYVGDIVSGIAAAALISNGVSYLYVLIIPAVVNGIWAIINFTAVFSTPEEAG
jgi:OPA family glycerol-3-phosphate transporter-like MFS transporter 1/2